MELPSIAGPISLNLFGDAKGFSSTTLWRYRQRGWLKTVNICGRPYILPSEAMEFERRAASGEFAKPTHGAAAKWTKQASK